MSTARESPISSDPRESSPPPIKLLKLLGYVKTGSYIKIQAIYGGEDYNIIHNSILCVIDQDEFSHALGLIRSFIVLCGRRHNNYYDNVRLCAI